MDRRHKAIRDITIGFVAPDQITDSGNRMAQFISGEFIDLQLSPEDGVLECDVVVAGQIDTLDVMGVKDPGTPAERAAAALIKKARYYDATSQQKAQGYRWHSTKNAASVPRTELNKNQINRPTWFGC